MHRASSRYRIVSTGVAEELHYGQCFPTKKVEFYENPFGIAACRAARHRDGAVLSFTLGNIRVPAAFAASEDQRGGRGGGTACWKRGGRRRFNSLIVSFVSLIRSGEYSPPHVPYHPNDASLETLG